LNVSAGTPRTARFGILAMAAFLIALAFQFHTTNVGFAGPMAERLWELRFKPDWERSALLQGGDVAGFVTFLRQQVPEDGKLILPPNFPLRPFAHVGYMQYYLFPRDIQNCGRDEVEACVRRIGGAKTFIMALPDFPPRALAEKTLRFIPYKDGMGVFAPR